MRINNSVVNEYYLPAVKLPQTYIIMRACTIHYGFVVKDELPVLIIFRFRP